MGGRHPSLRRSAPRGTANRANRAPTVGEFVVIAFATCWLLLGCGSQPVPEAPLLDSQATQEGTADASSFVAGKLLVKFKDASPDGGSTVLSLTNANETGQVLQTGVQVVELDPASDTAAQLRAFQARPEVEFAELDQVWEPALVPNDPWYASAVAPQWHLPMISAPAAWDVTTGSSSIVIAILDSGVNGGHSELLSKMVAGWNVPASNTDTSDGNGHGTCVAGIAAAASNNSLGVASVAWGCKLMPIRVSGADGTTTTSSIAAGLTWAADHGARVANVSYGGVSASPTVAGAAEYFQNQNGGGVVTVAAGNNAYFVSTADNPFVINVSATDQDDLMAYFSNTGNNIDLSAPGVAIHTIDRGGGYANTSGTSCSAPLVAGVAALALSVDPTLTGSELQDLLKQSADDRGSPGWDTSYGWGRVNAANAVNLAMAGVGGPADTNPPSVSIATPAAGSSVAGVVNVLVSAADDGSVALVSLSVDGASLDSDATLPYSFSWNTADAPNGGHSLQATARDAAGNESTAATLVQVDNAMDGTSPTVTIASPTNNTTIGRRFTVAATATDNVGVSRVELYVDGVLSDALTAAPYSFTIGNTRRWARGAHYLQCRAYDAAGNMGASTVVTVYKN